MFAGLGGYTAGMRSKLYSLGDLGLRLPIYRAEIAVLILG